MTAGLTAAKNSMVSTTENKVFITAQCRIKSASSKDQKNTDPSFGQWGKPWSQDVYLSGGSYFLRVVLITHFNWAEVLDEYLATLNVGWANDKGMELIP